MSPSAHPSAYGGEPAVHPGAQNFSQAPVYPPTPIALHPQNIHSGASLTPSGIGREGGDHSGIHGATSANTGPSSSAAPSPPDLQQPQPGHAQQSPSPDTANPHTVHNIQHIEPPTHAQAVPAGFSSDDQQWQQPNSGSTSYGVDSDSLEAPLATMSTDKRPLSYRRPPSGVNVLPPSTERRPLVSPMLAWTQAHTSTSRLSTSGMHHTEGPGAQCPHADQFSASMTYQPCQ